MKTILIDLKDLISASLSSHLAQAIQVSVDSPDPQKIQFQSPLTGKVIFTNLGPRLLANFDLQIKTKLICFRCSEWYHHNLSLDFDKTYKLSAVNSDNTLEILPAIQEEIILSIPLKSLCKGVCKGLCQECGQNLNLKKCHCAKNIRKAKNNPFAKLKSIIEKESDGRTKKEINS